LVTELKIVGTSSLSTEELATIAGDLTDACFDQDSDDIAEWIRDLFQNRGFFLSKVENVEIQPVDALATPTPVTVKAEVTEGPRCKIGDIQFTDNRAFSQNRLRHEFPIKKGDVFQRGKVASGLERVRDLYGSKGYIDLMMIPDTNLSSADGSVALSIQMLEGPQYHLGKLEIFAPAELADKLRAQWRMLEGAVFHRSYLLDYVRANRALLPANFVPQDMQVVRDCPNATVQVRVLIDPILAASHTTPRDVECETSQASSQ
jgi:outer membrane protein assembly factor BamA